MDLEVGNLEERQRVAMMVMDMGFRDPDEQVQTIENINVSLETLKNKTVNLNEVYLNLTNQRPLNSFQASVTGVVYICDTEGASAKLAKAVTPSFLKKLTTIYQVKDKQMSSKKFSHIIL